MAVDSIFNAKMKTPFAVLGIRTVGKVVTSIEYLPKAERGKAPDNALAERAVRQLERYLDDPEFRFSLSLAAAGTPFRERVRSALTGIPVGESRTYGELARQLHTARRSVSPRRGESGLAWRIHACGRWRPARDQALAPQARGIPLRRLTRSQPPLYDPCRSPPT